MSQPPPEEVPTHSVSALMTYEACPLQYYTVYVRRIPPPVTPAMRRGTNIHKLISDYLSKPSLFPPDVEPDAREMFDRFLASRFNTPPVLTEEAFLLPFDGAGIAGRMDVVIPGPDGTLEVVDFKTGWVYTPAEADRRLQLQLYALAVARRFKRSPSDVAYTYSFLRDGTELSFRLTDDRASALLARVDGIVDAIAQGKFEPTPGCTCWACRRQAMRGTSQ